MNSRDRYLSHSVSDHREDIEEKVCSICAAKGMELYEHLCTTPTTVEMETPANDNPAGVTDLDIVRLAFWGERGDDQKRIAEIGLSVLRTLLNKNRDYGSSVWETPELAPETLPSVAIRVRMSDKIKRIKQLLSNPSEVLTESINDTFKDLAGYSILYIARPDNVK